MRGIDSIFADDVKAKKEGIRIDLPGLQDQYILIAAFDAAKVNERIKKTKHYFYDDVDSPTQEEKNACFKSAVIEEVVKGWDIYESGEKVEFNDKNVKRILFDEKYERLLDFILSEAQSQENYRLKEIEAAKKK